MIVHYSKKFIPRRGLNRVIFIQGSLREQTTESIGRGADADLVYDEVVDHLSED